MNKKPLTPVLLTALAALLFSSCATLIQGTTTNLIIDGKNKEPVNIEADKQTYSATDLPIQVTVRRKHLNDPIRITSENYQYADIIPGRRISNVAWLDLYAWPGLFVDLINGSLYNPVRKCYYVHFAPKDDSIKVARLSPAVYSTPSFLQQKPDRLYRHELSIGFGFIPGNKSLTHRLDKMEAQTEALVGERQMEDFCGLPPINPVTLSASYYYHLNHRIALGATVGRTTDSRDFDHTDEEDLPLNIPYSPKRALHSTLHARSSYIMPSIKYTWGYFEWGSIYSKVSGGLQWQRFWININSANGFDHLTDSLHRLNYSRRRLGGHITFFGFEAGTGNIRFFTEVGYGLSCAWHSGISLHL